jgi:LPXTG-motif cell wall-anchored protein
MKHNFYAEGGYEGDSTNGTGGMEQKKAGTSPALIALGTVATVLLLGTLAYMVFFRPAASPQNPAAADVGGQPEDAMVFAQGTSTAQAATQSSLLAFANVQASQTPTEELAMVGGFPADAVTSTPDWPARTATVAALNTLMAAANTSQPTLARTPDPATATPPAAPATPRPTPSALPTTGVADDWNLPALGGVALGALLVIFIARRLRGAQH